MPPAILNNCSGCGRCVAVCRSRAIRLETEEANGFGAKRAVIDSDLCLDSGLCLDACPHGAIA